MITITLEQIRDASPCAGGWKKALKAHGPDHKPLPLSAILDSNKLDDTLWCLPEHDQLCRMVRQTS